MKLIFIGPQGCGKGTQAQIVSNKLEICHISTGDLLRGVKGDLKKEIDSYILNGKLVPDEIIIKVLKQRIEKKDCEKGFILDGFPRNKEQAEDLDKIMKIDKIILIDISDKETIKRLSGRLNCKKCGAVFNVNTNPSKKQGKCDYCNEELFVRDDDKPEAIKKRLEVYHKETEPILKHYKFVKVNGEEPIEKVTKNILGALGDKNEV